MSGSKDAQERAQASFKAKELQQRDGKKAMAEYEAAGQAMREKTARLRNLRLAKEAAEREAAAVRTAAEAAAPAADAAKSAATKPATKKIAAAAKKAAGAAAKKKKT